jgi:hypothetical protein
MPTNDEINNIMSNIIEGAVQAYNGELNAFHASQTTDASLISTWLGRTYQFSGLFFAYERVVRSLGTATPAQIDQASQLRSWIDGQVQQARNLLDHALSAQVPHQYQPLMAGQNAIQDAQRYQQQVMAEVAAKRQQMYAYTNRLRELTQGGVPYIQAELIAKQETGYRG